MADHNDITFAAMCLWEEVLTIRSREDVADAFDEWGTNAVREWVARTLAPACQEDWDALDWSFDEPFDWGFVPRWIDEHVDWTDHSQIGNLMFVPKAPKPDFFHLGAEAECASK